LKIQQLTNSSVKFSLDTTAVPTAVQPPTAVPTAVQPPTAVPTETNTTTITTTTEKGKMFKESNISKLSFQF
jgi:hypothetical protein